MTAACAVVLALKAETEEEVKDPGDWRDTDTSRRRFWRLRYGVVSGPREALCRRRELCGRWLRPERRSRERRLRDHVRHRQPQRGEEAAAWTRRALHPASPQGTPTFKAEAGAPTGGEWQQLTGDSQNDSYRESTEDYRSSAVPGLETQAAWNPDLISKQEEDCKEEAKPAQAWVQGAPLGTTTTGKRNHLKMLSCHCHSPRVLQESQRACQPHMPLGCPRRKSFGEMDSQGPRPPRRSLCGQERRALEKWRAVVHNHLAGPLGGQEGGALEK